jgi:hypothetical protein
MDAFYTYDAMRTSGPRRAIRAAWDVLCIAASRSTACAGSTTVTQYDIAAQLLIVLTLWSRLVALKAIDPGLDR